MRRLLLLCVTLLITMSAAAADYETGWTYFEFYQKF